MNERNSRQSFLGDSFLNELNNVTVAIIGLGGGGSIIFSELAHIGFKNYFICDPDDFEESNINRLLGSIDSDIQDKTSKITIAERTIKRIIPNANVVSKKSKWQLCLDDPTFLKSKIIFSCLDNFSNRKQVEAFARKHGIILIDIGLKIQKQAESDYQMMGQIVMSHPNGPCFSCYNFITDKDLEKEALNYGDAGIRPQVIWANGILASASVGLGIEILSNWTNSKKTYFYKHFDGNKLSLTDNLKISAGTFSNEFRCPHF